MTIDASTTALLVIDMQHDFVDEKGVIAVRGIQKSISKYKKFVQLCRRLGIPVFYTRHCFLAGKNPIEEMLFPSLAQGGLRPGTPGHAIVKDLAPAPGDAVIDKWRYDAFFGTDLGDMLAKRGIRDVVITGTMTEVCCESTARSAMYRDLRVWFISDLTFTSDPGRHAASLDVVRSHIGIVLSADEAIIAIR